MTCLLCIGLAGVQAKADIIDYTYRGDFTYHNDVLYVNFSMVADGNITLFSSSWVRGGFDPILVLWDAAGRKIYEQDDGYIVGTTMVDGVEYAHGNWDSYFEQELTAGDYIVTIVTYENRAKSDILADGFRYDSRQGILFQDWHQPFNGIGEPFFEFHILGATSVEVTPPHPSPTPEPGTFALSALGLGMLAFVARRRRNC